MVFHQGEKVGNQSVILTRTWATKEKEMYPFVF